MRCAARRDPYAAAILIREEDLAFASLMVQNLNVILMTSPELADLRSRLKNMATPEAQDLFVVLYRCVVIPPVIRTASEAV